MNTHGNPRAPNEVPAQRSDLLAAEYARTPTAVERPLHILLVQDSPDDTEAMLLALRQGGLEPTWERVETADGLRAALASGPWDAVLSACTLAGFGAAAALALVRSSDPDLPFIVVSGSVGEDMVTALMRATASDFILKHDLVRLAPAVEREAREAGNRRAKRAAERAAAHLAAVVESSGDAIISKTLDGVLTSWNPAAERLYGWTATEAVGRHVSFLIPPDKADELAGIMGRLRAGEQIEYFETVRLHRDGRRIDVAMTISPVRDADGRLVGVSKTARDIQERKRAEADLRQSAERYRGLIESIPALVWVCDTTGRPELHNRRWYEYTGTVPEDDAGDGWEEALHPDDVTGAVAAWDRCKASGEPYAFEYRLRRADGVYRWFLSRKTALRGPNGIEQWVGFCTDIDDRKRVEQRLTAQHAVVSILAQSPDLREAAPSLLQAVCETTGWDVGDLWVVDRQANVLSFVDLWHVEGVAVAEFRDLSRQNTFAPGVGLPGRVWAAGQPAWVVDITRDPNFPRAGVAAKAGLRGGFAFPIQFGKEVLGVAEFFSRESRQPDEELSRMFDSLGSQIGQFMERKRVEAGLHLFRALIDQTTDGIEVIDPETGRFLDVNETVCVAHGYTRAEYLSLSAPELDSLVVSKSWEEVISERRLTAVQTFESEHRRKDGSTFPVEINLNAIHLDRDYLVTVVRDITDRKRTEDALRLRDRAIKAATQGILITDPTRSDNPIVYASPGFERLTGYTGAEVVGRNCRFLQGKVTDPAVVTRVREAVRTGGPCTVELQNYRKDGTLFWNELSISPVRDASGRLTHFVGVQVDVTARRALEEQFRQAQKMEAFGQLAGGVAHDFNNLLTVINGYSDLLLQRLPAGDPNRPLVAEIHKAGERSAGLTRQLLAFSRQQVLAPQVLDLNVVVADTEKMLRRLIGEDMRLATTLGPGLWAVRADPGQVEQVLMNLAVNARDAMPRGGRLTIETRNVELDETYVPTHPDARAGPHVLLCVTDTGTGMPPEVKTRIFEPFFTTKGVGKGTGLGLSTVFGIVKQSGGHLAVESEVGVGTSFKVYFPRVEKVAGGSKAPFRSPTLPKGTETILLIEDDDGVRLLTRHVLTNFGYRVLEASGGADALRVLAKHAGPVHLLITDVVMPGMSGRQVAAEVAGLHPEVRVLFVSGYTDDAIVRHGILEEKVHFLPKPFSPAALAAKVRDVLDQTAPDGA